MTVEDNSGLATVEKIYQDYGSRAAELKKQGKKIIGYLCAYVPLEIITAAGLIPFRIRGSYEGQSSRGDSDMENIVCDHIRNCFALSVAGKYEFLDGLVIPHACDNISRTYDIWKYTLGLSYTHFLNLPHNTDESSLEFFKAVLGTFIASLETFTGKEVSRACLTEAVKLYNRNRTKIRELYEFRKPDPPLISGVQTMQTLLAGLSLPVEESTQLIDSVIHDIRHHKCTVQKSGPRIMLVGTELEDVSFIKLIEDCGANVVIDELCPGTRENFPLASVTDEPINDIAERYLRKINCARTYFELKGSYPEYLGKRYGSLGQSIRDYNIDGVILYIHKYCDPFGFDVPEMKSYIESLHVPVLYLEEDYSMSAVTRLTTKIQAFLEIITLRQIDRIRD